MWYLILIVVAIISFLTYVIISKKKRKEASWSGIVVDKDIIENVHTSSSGSNRGGLINIGFGSNINQSNVTHDYKIKVKGDDGREFGWPVSHGFYEQVGIGDRLTKEPGTEIPTIVLKAQPQTSSDNSQS